MRDTIKAIGLGFMFWVLLIWGAILGMERQERALAIEVPPNPHQHSWADHPAREGSINVWRKLDGEGEVWK